MTAACEHPNAFLAGDGFGGVRCMCCFDRVVARPSLGRLLFRWIRGGAR